MITKARCRCNACGYVGLLTIWGDGSHLDHCTACLKGRRVLIAGTERQVLTPKEKRFKKAG